MTAPARRVWAAILVVHVVWGSTYLAIKVVVDTIPPPSPPEAACSGPRVALRMLLLGVRPSPWTLAGALLVIRAVYAAVREESPARSKATGGRAATKRPAPAPGSFPRPDPARAEPALAEPT